MRIVCARYNDTHTPPAMVRIGIRAMLSARSRWPRARRARVRACVGRARGAIGIRIKRETSLEPRFNGPYAAVLAPGPADSLLACLSHQWNTQ
eukprot:SAG31_NODE_757_length_12296_cov_8.840289_6_plen_93_part_00